MLASYRARPMAVKRPMRVLGFMTGTSLDAVDMAVLETDGESIQRFGPAGERKLASETRALLQAATDAALAWTWDAPRPVVFARAAEAIAEVHLAAARDFMREHALSSADIDLVGFHGQTVLHQPPTTTRARGRTVQLGDAARLAEGLGLPVAHDFRTADVAAGGQGAPLAPIYHQALANWSGLERPLAVLNLGGVGNITMVGKDGLAAFDTGPANGMIDLWVQSRTGDRCDEGGALAAAGRIDAPVLNGYLAHRHFSSSGPRSLDRYDFSMDPVEHLDLRDGAATLTAFAAAAVVLGLESCATAPRQVIVCGGGRHNPSLLAEIRRRTRTPVATAEDIGWRGDSIEAEAFAYLAARVVRGLPISFPTTTGAPRPMTGGRLALPAG